MTVHENERKWRCMKMKWNEVKCAWKWMKGLCLKIECVDCAWKWNKMKMKWDYEQLENVSIKQTCSWAIICVICLFFSCLY